jgi:hypothetical protein
MRRNSASGANWVVDGDIFTIFGKSGWVNGNFWVLPADSPSEAHIELAPTPFKLHVDRLISIGIHNGNGDRIAYVGVGAYQGLLLALEGVVTAAMLRSAQETADCIVIANVPFERGPRKLIILKNAMHMMAAFDRNDRVI